MDEKAPGGLILTPFQKKVAAVPEQWDVFLGGGRGGGKSTSLAVLALRHAQKYGQRAKMVFVRRSFAGSEDFVGICRTVFGQAYGGEATYNASSHIWRLPGEATLEIGILDDASTYQRFQGRSFTTLLADEVGQYSDPSLLGLLRSNLRSDGDVPTRVCFGANPGDQGHAWLYGRYVSGSTPWVSFVEKKSGRRWVYCPSTVADNPHLGDEYEVQIRAATVGDSELRRAWLTGAWDIERGAFFGSVLEQGRVAISPWPTPKESEWWGSAKGEGWDFYLSHDYGSTAPSVTLVCALSPGANGPDGRWYAAGSIIAIDELATYSPDSPAKGLDWPIPKLADAIRELAVKWGIRAWGVADDAIFGHHGHSTGSIADELRIYKVHFRPARKASRIAGWARLRRLLADAGKPDVPGVYISRDCAYTWMTLPFLPRCPRRAEDVDTRAIDHAGDCLRYSTMMTRPRVESRKFRWA